MQNPLKKTIEFLATTESGVAIDLLLQGLDLLTYFQPDQLAFVSANARMYPPDLGLPTPLSLFEVNGVKVNAKNAAIVPANRTLANDAYVRVKGTYADTGELVASQVEIRRKADSDFITEVSLNGSITDYVSLASFKVRGVPVDAGSATLSNCPATLSNGLYVETAGNVGKTGVVATKVSCKDAPEAASIEVRGVASAVDPTALKFTLTSGGKAFDVQWNSQTRFSGVAAATLNGAQVKVEGYLKSGILIAKKISK